MQLDLQPIMVIDCQTTATQATTGEVMEIGWAFTSAAEIRETGVDACAIRTSLLALPEGAQVTGTVARLTGLKQADLAQAPQPAEIWRECLSQITVHPMPTVIHYSRFEIPFLKVLQERHGEGALPFDFLCTYQIAKKLIPGLPSSTLRAVSGHFGRVLGEAHRAEDHVRATLWIWQHLVERLKELGVNDWPALQSWVAEKPPARKGKTKREYLLPREKRLALPAQPGVYRMLSRDGKLLYVGKATSLKDRVNSYFRTRTTTRTRMPEMMAQVHDIDVTPLETSVEAALLETDEIKRWNPPYNASLRTRGTQLTFWSRDFSRFQFAPDEDHPLGPFPGHQTLEQLSAVAALLVSGEDPFGVLLHIEDAETIAAGAALFLRRHHLPAGEEQLSPPALLNLGARLPAPAEESKSEEEAYTAEDAADSLENILRRTAALAHRTRWLCRLTDASISWRHRDGERRLLHFVDGKWTGGETMAAVAETPAPSHWQKDRGTRQSCFDLVTYDRLSVLYTEIRRLLSEEKDVEIRLSPKIHFRQPELKRYLGA